MSKQSGLGDRFFVGGSDLSGDVNAISQMSGSQNLLDVTALKDSAYERLGGLRDASWSFTTWMDNASGAEHPQLSTLPRTDVIATYFRGAALGNAAASINGKQLNYDPTRGADGSLSLAVSVQANGFGMEWGEQLTPGLRTDTTATNGTAVDDGAGTSNGAQAYLQFTSISGGTAAGVRIEHSTSGTASWTTLMDFGNQTTAGAARTSTSGTVNRFTRAVTYGTAFTSATFAVQLTRNLTAVSF